MKGTRGLDRMELEYHLHLEYLRQIEPQNRAGA